LTVRPARSRTEPDRAPLLVFDGECGFCTSAANWARRGWRGPERAVPWQLMDTEELRAVGLTVELAQEAAWWVDPHGRLWRGHRAIGRSLTAGRGWRRAAGTIVLARPISPLAAYVYELVVRHRDRLPGATPACRSPEAPK